MGEECSICLSDMEMTVHPAATTHSHAPIVRYGQVRLYKKPHLAVQQRNGDAVRILFASRIHELRRQYAGAARLSK
jgi:hypothetical protein